MGGLVVFTIDLGVAAFLTAMIGWIVDLLGRMSPPDDDAGGGGGGGGGWRWRPAPPAPRGGPDRMESRARGGPPRRAASRPAHLVRR
jgi:hypothetical protein